MTPDEERYLRGILEASDAVKAAHQHLQKEVKHGTQQSIIEAGTALMGETESLLRAVRG